ncbi:MAG: M23 family metallopeptidase [Gaiellaceae bacterium]
MRLSVTLALVGVLLTTGSAGATQRSPRSGATARAFAIRVVVPGRPDVVRLALTAPPAVVGSSIDFAYPADGSDISTGALTSSAATDVFSTARATASSQVTALSLFRGEVTAGTVTARALASTRGPDVSGDLSGASIADLIVLGQPVTATPNERIPLGDWGYAITLEQSSSTGSSPRAPAYKGSVTALDVHLTAAHAGLPANSEILVGYAETSLQTGTSDLSKPSGPAPRPRERAKAAAAAQPKPPEPKRGQKPGLPPSLRPIPQGLEPKLTAGRYVFPVYGLSSFTDTFGAARADTIWHHGDDIFAPLGAPLLAVADGRVFSVGWNAVGGNRLWLRDNQGNEFYYAHLSAFTRLAKNGANVKAGTVLGFVGNTGDAEGTPYHLHFEVHPVSLLYLGYDGAVDPTVYLTAWKHLQDVQFTAVAGWVPSGTGSNAPRPGAILLQASDISAASGLDPGSLQRALVAPVSSEAPIGSVPARIVALRVG